MHVLGHLGPSVRKTSCFSQFPRARETTHFCIDSAILVSNSEKIVVFYVVLGPALLKTRVFLTIHAVISTISCVFTWFLKHAFRKRRVLRALSAQVCQNMSKRRVFSRVEQENT